MAVRWRDTMFFNMAHKLTEEQEAFNDSIENYRMTISNSPSGTGKTTLAVGMAKLLGKPLLYVFNPTEEDKLGFRPGTTGEKEHDYLGPLRDALEAIGENFEDAVYQDKYGDMKSFHNRKAWITACSHTFVRGTNKKDMTVIIDEAQNWLLKDLKKMISRLHDSCTVIIIGHLGQIDLKNPSQSGFRRVIEHFSTKHYCNVVNLTKNFRGEMSRDADDL